MTAIPDTVTQTLSVHQLQVGHVLLTPMVGSLETVTGISQHGGYYDITTDRTDFYTWPGTDPIRVLAGRAHTPLRCSRCAGEDGPFTDDDLCEACARPMPLDGVA